VIVRREEESAAVGIVEAVEQGIADFLGPLEIAGIEVELQQLEEGGEKIGVIAR